MPKKKKKIFPLSLKKLTQCSQDAQLCSDLSMKTSDLPAWVVADEAVSHMLCFMRYEKELVIWVFFDMSYQFTRETQNPSFRQAKLYSLLAYVTWIPEMEYFCFKELTCGQAQWHQAMSSPLKQYRLAEADTIFLFYYTGNVSNFAVLWAANIKEVKRGVTEHQALSIYSS